MAASERGERNINGFRFSSSLARRESDLLTSSSSLRGFESNFKISLSRWFSLVFSEVDQQAPRRTHQSESTGGGPLVRLPISLQG